MFINLNILYLRQMLTYFIINNSLGMWEIWKEDEADNASVYVRAWGPYSHDDILPLLAPACYPPTRRAGATGSVPVRPHGRKPPPPPPSRNSAVTRTRRRTVAAGRRQSRLQVCTLSRPCSSIISWNSAITTAGVRPSKLESGEERLPRIQQSPVSN
jgi:hypothetical protein